MLVGAGRATFFVKTIVINQIFQRLTLGGFVVAAVLLRCRTQFANIKTAAELLAQSPEHAEHAVVIQRRFSGF